MNKHMQVYIPEDLHRTLKIMAAKNGVGLTKMISQMLARAVLEAS